jgi:hypothetical protein
MSESDNSLCHVHNQLTDTLFILVVIKLGLIVGNDLKIADDNLFIH